MSEEPAGPRRPVAGPAASAADEVHVARPSSIAAGGVDALLFRGLEFISLILLVVVTARLMEPAGRGLYALASLTAALCGLPLGSVWVANTVELAAGRTRPREILGASIVLASVGGLVTGAVALAFAPLLGDRWWVVALPAAVTPFMLLARYLEGLYTSLGHVRAVNFIIVGRAVLPLVFITPPLLAGASTRTAIAIWTLAFVALPVIVYFPLRSLLGPPSLPRDRSLYRRVVTYGLRVSGSNALLILNERVGLVALAIFATETDVGIYSVAVAGAQVLLLATQALALSSFRRIGTDAREGSAALTVRTVRHAILIAAVGGLLLVPVVTVAIPWTVGHEYDDVPLLLAVLVPGAVCLAGLPALSTFFSVQMRAPGVMLAVAGGALAGTGALSLALTPLWGSLGVAAASTLGSAVAAVVAFRYFRGHSGTRLGDLRPGRRELQDYVSLASSYLGRFRRAAG